MEHLTSGSADCRSSLDILLDVGRRCRVGVLHAHEQGEGLALQIVFAVANRIRFELLSLLELFDNVFQL